MSLPEHLTWAPSELHAALTSLARAAGLRVRETRLHLPSSLETADALAAWITDAAATLGVEADPLNLAYADVESTLSSRPPLIALVGDRFLAVAAARGARLEILTPRLERVGLPRSAARAAVCAVAEGKLARVLERLGRVAGHLVVERGEARLKRRLSGGQRVLLGFALGPTPAERLSDQLVRAHVFRQGAWLLTAHGAEIGLTVASFGLLGWSALGGRLDVGWLVAWALALASQLPLRAAGARLQGRLAVSTGFLLRRRLLEGALSLPVDRIRREGVGHLLGRVFEGEAVSALSVDAGLDGALAAIELTVAVLVLAQGAGAAAELAVVGGWVLVALVLTVRFHRSRRAWTHARVDLTHRLVEHLVGHRTRLAQLPRGRWPLEDDDALEGYVHLAQRMDRHAAALETLLARGVLLTGILALVPAFVARATPSKLAIAIGGVLLSQLAFRRLSRGLSALVAALQAWEQAAPVLSAALVPEAPPPLPPLARPAEGDVVLEARDLEFRYEGRRHAVLSGVSLTLRAGDRLLVQGRSGAGKSTLGALVAGLRVPSSGLLLLRGLDCATWGIAAWKRSVVLVPQLHENHVVGGSLAFNLLLGRRWPPRTEDLVAADQVCRELGLGELLDRMPGGLDQTVGETGWQLSHGEQSRVLLARAVLQDPDVMVVDEALAALDPVSLRVALDCLLVRARTLIVIEHR